MVKWSCYRPSVAQRVGRGTALLFHDRGTRRGWVVSSTPRPHFNPRKDLVPILQEAGWAPGPVWTGGKSRPHRDSIPDRPARSKSLYRLSYPAHCTDDTSAINNFGFGKRTNRGRWQRFRTSPLFQIWIWRLPVHVVKKYGDILFGWEVIDFVTRIVIFIFLTRMNPSE